MAGHFLHCNKCSAKLPAAIYNAPGPEHCPSCGVPVRIDVFPALFTPLRTGTSAAPLIDEDTSSCYYHPQKKAALPCEICGRFLCALCDIEFNEQHLCPGCVETGKNKRRIRNLENHRVLYDRIALFLSLFPLLFFWVTLITAPASIFIAFRHWKSPLSIIPRTKVRFVFAIMFAFIQISGWVFLFAYSII